MNPVKFCLNRWVDIREFQERVWEYYRQHGRALPWREPEADGSFDAYKVLVSEIMLQQTQANRVIPKYSEFLEKFPTVRKLADAALADVLRAWSGLGYNRRAKYLHEAAKALAGNPQPWSLTDLTACKGIGHNTAAAVVAYAYDEPVVFVETNIRTVFIHHFFTDKDGVHDKEILPLVEGALDCENPREFYWALMDYGTHLKATVGNASRASKHYARQSEFHGSARQLRGHVLRLLGERHLTREELAERLVDDRTDAVIDGLVREGLVSKHGAKLSLG